MIQAWRWLDLSLECIPGARISFVLAAAIYLNFFSHHWIVDLRWPLAGALIWWFRHTRVCFTPRQLRLCMPLPLAFGPIGFFVWIAENAATLLGAWRYPHQQAGWRMVQTGKIGAWSLLVVITFVAIADLKHWKARRSG